MAERSRNPLEELGIYRRGEDRPPMTRLERWAAVGSAAWVVGLGLYLLAGRGGGPVPDSLRFVMTLLAVFLPVAVIWVGVAAARSSRAIREESDRLNLAIEALRDTFLEVQREGGATIKSSVERKLEEIAAAQRKTENAIATFTSIRTGAAAPAAADDEAPALPEGGDAEGDADEQGRLALATPREEEVQVSIADFIRALNFPDTAEDKEGFQALRRALRQRSTAQLVQSAQDVLTLLSQDGIYMDDLRPDRARPEVWRQFAQGVRGGEIAPLGGIRDRSCLALAAGRMRSDGEFRDKVHGFLRRFDQIFAEFEKVATDEQIAALADTRTARAFMLLGRVTGIFD